MTTPAFRIRGATVADAAAICRIYNQGIQDRVATLETEERTPEERAEWLEARDARHPVLVAEAEGGVVGWASLNVFNARRAYEHVADLSLYVEREWRGQGVGRRLLEALVARARALGYHKLVLAAFPWNEARHARLPARGLPRGGDLPGAGAPGRALGGHDRHGEDPRRPQRPTGSGPDFDFRTTPAGARVNR